MIFKREIVGLTVLGIVIVSLASVAISKSDAQRNYVGDCVDIVAQREGAERLTPEEKWNQFSQYCAERYADR